MALGPPLRSRTESSPLKPSTATLVCNFWHSHALLLVPPPGSCGVLATQLTSPRLTLWCRPSPVWASLLSAPATCNGDGTMDPDWELSSPDSAWRRSRPESSDRLSSCWSSWSFTSAKIPSLGLFGHRLSSSSLLERSVPYRSSTRARRDWVLLTSPLGISRL